MSLETFTNAYLHCILWAETDDNDNPLDATYDVESFAPQALESIKADCASIRALKWLGKNCLITTCFL